MNDPPPPPTFNSPVPAPPLPPQFMYPLDWHARAVKRINELVPNAGNCPACGPLGIGRMFIAQDLVASVTLNLTGSVNYAGLIYPEVMAICGNCGFSRRFNYNMLMANEPVR